MERVDRSDCRRLRYAFGNGALCGDPCRLLSLGGRMNQIPSARRQCGIVYSGFRQPHSFGSRPKRAEIFFASSLGVFVC